MCLLPAYALHFFASICILDESLPFLAHAHMLIVGLAPFTRPCLGSGLAVGSRVLVHTL